MRKLSLFVALVGCAVLSPAAPSSAYEYGSNFGFYDVNVPGFPTVPAFTGAKAVWVGTCDLSSGDTSEGGIGSAPPVRAHCMDMGVPPTFNPDPTSVWEAGQEPSWRLRPVTQAGAHPDVTAHFRFRRAPTGISPDGNVKNIIVKLPLGVVGNPEALDKCAAIEAQAIPPACGPSAQAGVTTLSFFPSAAGDATMPIYNIEPRDTITAEFTIAFVQQLANVPLTARGRTNSDYGVDTLALLIPAYLPLAGTVTTFWGTSWAAEHDKFRVDSIPYFSQNLGNNNSIPETTGLTPPNGAQSYDSSWGPIKPFFTNPTSCTGTPPTLTLEADNWQFPASHGGSFVSATAPTEPVTGCEKLEFDPGLKIRPTVDVSDSPSGLDVTLSIPQNNDPPASIPGNPDLAHDPNDATGAPAFWKTEAGLATAHLKDTTVRLPAGTSFNPAAANGLDGCTTEQIGLTSTNPATFNNDLVQCPESSKIGTLEIVSPLLADPLEGAVYAAPQNDNPFPGTLTSIYMISQDEERGLSIKLAGRVDLDPSTGQISTTFVDNPQLPFETFTLKFKEGPRAPLNNPAVCGQFKNSIDLTPWSFPHSGPPSLIEDPFPIARMPGGLGCVTEPEDRVFGPGFDAGSTASQAGAGTQFVANISRADGHQELSSLSFQMPSGLTANLTQTPYCPDATIASIAGRTGLQETASPSCPAASRIGAVNTLAGAGSLPLPTSGRLYLAGPYDPEGAQPRAPLSVVGVVSERGGGKKGEPDVEIGKGVVCSPVYLDPVTAKVTVAPTRLPYIVGGVPLRVRRISVHIDKPGFMLNPTNCSEMSIDGTLGGAADPLDPNDDVSVSASSRFQVGGCASLGFRPKLSLRLKGGTGRGANPALSAVLTPRPGDANIARAAVTMPRSTFLANENIRSICTRVQYAANQCPAGSVYGTATAYSPLLNEPLTGPVYLRSSSNELPDMVASLHGQIDVELIGRIDSFKRRIRSTFDVVPDAPVTKFVLKMQGGRKSLIENSNNLCAQTNRASAVFLAQNGRRLSFRPKVVSGCGKSARKGKGGKRRSRR